MKNKGDISRRDFIKTAAVASASLGFAGTGPAFSSDPKETKIKIAGFTKALQSLSYEETAQVAAEIGWDSIECPVRPRGHVLPENVEQDLPKMVEALNKHGLEISVMNSRIRNVNEQHTEKMLRTASKLGIKYYRLGPMKYKKKVPIIKQLNELRAELKDIVALNKELGICGVIQNHAGSNHVGAAVWDIYELIKNMDHNHIGIVFDIAHATTEGGLCWPTHFRLARPMTKAVVAKDFYWQFTPGKGGKVIRCPLGKGMVDSKFFAMLKNSGFQGSISQHFAYPVEGKNNNEKLKNRIDGMKADYRKLKELLAV